jgi:hypothetical protein
MKNPLGAVCFFQTRRWGASVVLNALLVIKRRGAVKGRRRGIETVTKHFPGRRAKKSTFISAEGKDILKGVRLSSGRFQGGRYGRDRPAGVGRERRAALQPRRSLFLMERGMISFETQCWIDPALAPEPAPTILA